jgi:hypothetical protein
VTAQLLESYLDGPAYEWYKQQPESLRAIGSKAVVALEQHFSQIHDSARARNAVSRFTNAIHDRVDSSILEDRELWERYLTKLLDTANAVPNEKMPEDTKAQQVYDALPAQIRQVVRPQANVVDLVDCCKSLPDRTYDDVVVAVGQSREQKRLIERNHLLDQENTILRRRMDAMEKAIREQTSQPTT